MSIQSPKPFTVIGGFLGAGKTTLLNHILNKSTGTRYAVLVNDFGAINIDQTLIETHDGQTLALSNGCICCSMSNGFINTMLKLMQKPDAFDHIIVEASGVSEPERIMDFARLDPALTPGSIIVLVDAAEIEIRLADKHINQVINTQIKSANFLLLNKTDQVHEISSIKSSLQKINTVAPIIECVNAEINVTHILHQPSNSIDRQIESKHAPTQIGFETQALVSNTPIDRDKFNRFTENLPNQIIRGKGTVIFNNEQNVVYVWQHVGSTSTLVPRLNADNGETKIVLIGTEQFSPELFGLPFISVPATT